MPRYIFKPKDLEPLRTWLDQPVARQVLEAAVPIKRFDLPPQFSESPVDLPVDVQSLDKPDGVPLHAILKAVQAQNPAVVGITVRGNRAFLKYGSPPKDKDRDKGTKVLRDKDALEKLKVAGKPSLPSGADLEKVVLDEGTPDAEWLRAFRRYASENIIKAKKVTK